MSTPSGKLSCLRKLSSEKLSIEVNSWDSAIRKAKLRIRELKIAVETFQENKKAGEPWLGNSDAKPAA
jgi:hypothetical protein